MQDIKAATQPSHSRRQKHIFIKELAYGRHTIFAAERPRGLRAKQTESLWHLGEEGQSLAFSFLLRDVSAFLIPSDLAQDQEEPIL
jgi:hypothetical protein